MNIPDIPNAQTNPLYEAYKELFTNLFEKDYKIITDSQDASEDTFFFMPSYDKHINKTEAEYITKKRNKIALCLISEGILEPYSVTFPKDSFLSSSSKIKSNPQIAPTCFNFNNPKKKQSIKKMGNTYKIT